MISSFLSRVFFWSFIIVMVGGLAAMVGQAMQLTLPVKIANRFTLIFSQPGIQVMAKRINAGELAAPDTTVSYRFKKNELITSGGSMAKRLYMNDGAFTSTVNAFKKIAEERRQNGEQLILDTQIAVIAQSRDGEYRQEPGNPGNMVDNHSSGNKISQENNIIEALRIKPANNLQRFSFAFYNLLNLASYGFLFLILSRLFRNFYNRQYFTASNTKLIQQAGWLLLLPQLLAITVYWMFLHDINPMRSVITGAGHETIAATYDIIIGLDWTLVLLSLALLVLSYIFKDGLKLQQENSLII